MRWYVLWCIIYKKHDSIIRQSYENDLSSESVREIAKMLGKRSIVKDYGNLFPMSSKQEDMNKRSRHNFETTNWVKVVAKSLGKTTRWSNTYSREDGKSYRPSLVIFDDIDVVKSVTNEVIIEKNYNKITSETIWSLDPLRNKVVFLGNTIFEDWVVPRMYNNFKDKDSRDCFRQPLIDANGNNCWIEVFTPEIVKSLEDMGDVFFMQNYLLIPYSWNGIVKRSWIKYTNLKKHYVKIFIGADPASSTKQYSDGFGLVVCGETEDWYKDILCSYNLTWQEKEKDNVLDFIFNLYIKVKAQLVRFETVNAYSYIADDLRKLWVAVNNVNPNKDKVTRLLEHESDIKNGKVRFVSDWDWLNVLLSQLILFPNSKHDDLVDAFVFSISKTKREFTTR